tara:strand:- start:422 stop:1216 length:795 start_codon:yes stop_codon:yes gene_type:complete
MITEPYVYGTFQGNPTKVGVSSENEYFPIYSLEHKEEILNGVFSYEKPIKRHRLNIYTYLDLVVHFKESLSCGKFSFKYKGEPNEVYAIKGCILDKESNILLLLGANDKNLFDKENLVNSKLRLYVSSELLKNENYKNLYKYLYSNYIQECIDEDVQFVVMTSKEIEKRVFSNTFELKYDNVTELNEHLKNDIADIFNFKVPTIDVNPIIDIVETVTREQFETAINLEGQSEINEASDRYVAGIDSVSSNSLTIVNVLSDDLAF